MATELDLGTLPKVVPLFEAFPYDTADLRSVLEDPKLRVFADQERAPQAVLLCPQRSVVAFGAGEAGLASAVLDFAMAVQENPPLTFLSLPNESWREQIVAAFPHRFYEKHRVSYALADRSKTQNWQSQVPVDFRMQRLDRRSAEQVTPQCSSWFRRYWPDAAQFVAQGLGYGLVHGSRVVSIAYSAHSLSKNAEIVVETDSEYRGQGLAPLCCAAFIQECLQQGIEPLYSTDLEHEASICVARKVRFGNEKLHCWLSGFG